MARKRKKNKLAHRYGRSMGRRGHSYNGEGETGIPVRVHGVLYITPHADERITETIAEVVEEIAPMIVEEAIEDAVEAVPETMREMGIVVAPHEVEVW